MPEIGGDGMSMGQKRIVVVSKRPERREFFALEGMACGCSVTETEALPADMAEFDIIILDGDRECGAISHNCRVIRIAENEDEIDEDTWEFPVSVLRVRELFYGIPMTDTHPTTEGDASVLVVDKSEKTVTVCNRRVVLTDGEWSVFLLLLSNKGNAVSRNMLMELFGASRGNISDVYICHLRKKLELPLGTRLILTVRDKGYMLSENVKIIEIN